MQQRLQERWCARWSRKVDDIASEDGFFEYRFMGDDPGHGDNRGLREAFEGAIIHVGFHPMVKAHVVT